MSSVDPDWVAPSSPEDKKKIAGAIEEIVNALTLIAGQQDHIKAIREDLEEKYEMPKSLSYLIAKDRFRDEVRKRAAASETYQTAVESLFPGSIVPHENISQDSSDDE
jgi:predicted RNA binding protein with dsRBD fold (UPF0201 family)